MNIKFNVIKEERKALVAVVSDVTGRLAIYQGAPGFGYAVGDYVIDRYGTLVYDDDLNTNDVRYLLEKLTERGFVFEGDIDVIAPAVTVPDGAVSNETYHDETVPSDSGTVANGELADGADTLSEAMTATVSAGQTFDQLVIEIPADGFNRTAYDNLERLISGKSSLITKAIGLSLSDDADSLLVERTESTLQFPWFPASASPDEIDAYTRFVCALCDMAKKQKRVVLREANVDSEKFAFRCFLLRLGFIGKEYAMARKILLSKLSGNGSFRNGDHKRDKQEHSAADWSGCETPPQWCPISADSGDRNGDAINTREDGLNADSAATEGETAANA